MDNPGKTGMIRTVSEPVNFNKSELASYGQFRSEEAARMVIRRMCHGECLKDRRKVY